MCVFVCCAAVCACCGVFLMPCFPPPNLQVLSTIVVLGDIGHVSKPYDVHKEWAGRITQEFYRQGDMERGRGMAISPLCDRGTGNLAKSQVGFFHYLILPLYR